MALEKTNQQNSIRTNRIFILDTNVLLHDARSIFSFHGVVIGIPFIVLEELDNFKSDNNERGRNSRAIIRSLDQLRSLGSLSTGVELGNGTRSLLKVYPTPTNSDNSVECHTLADNVILQTVKNLVQEGNIVTFVTKDINARVKADALSLDAEDYIKGKVSDDHFYRGWVRIPIEAQTLKSATTKKALQLAEHEELFVNQFIVLESKNNPENFRLFRFLGGSQCKEVANITLMDTFSARNLEQMMAIDLLMDNSIQLVSLPGSAGTGKTFLTLLVGLYKVLRERTYRKLLVTRPVIALGADIGFLPGDVEDKLHYWMQPIQDNLEFIASQMNHATAEHMGLTKKGDKHSAKKHDHERNDPTRRIQRDMTHFVQQLQQQGALSLEAITYMRGRSIPNQFVFIDEVQNLTPHEVKTIISRAGQGTKVILAGDPYQIDSPYLDFSSNGLIIATEKFKNNRIFGTAFLQKSERSELAQLATEVF